MIIGLSGHAGAGKDAAAKTLVQLYGFQRLAFADALKQAAKAIFTLSDAQVHGSEKEVFDPFWGMTPRAILQRLGTECLRQGFADDVWIKALFRQVEPHENYVITDVRFPNEADEVRRWGGYVVRIERPGAKGERMLHASETALEGYKFDAVIMNDGTLGELGLKVHSLVGSLAGGAAA
jgi:hypothetical protein